MEKDMMVSLISEIVQNNIEKIGKVIVDFTQEKADVVKVKYGNAFKTYLCNAVDKHSKVKTIINRSEAVELDKFYVNMDLLQGKKNVLTDDINNLINLANCILIVGTAGMGKSTLMKYLFLNAIEKTKFIPVFVELKDLNGYKFDLITCIYKSMHNLGFDLDFEYLIRALEFGKFIFFFDGFDEIENHKRGIIRQEIIDLSDKYKTNFYIVSSRGSTEFNSWVRFFELTIKPLDKEKAKFMISKLNYDETIKKKFLKELHSKLYKNNESFASNPLLLTIMFMTYNQYAEIPEKKHEFYAAAFDVLYSQHDATKGLKRDRFTKISLTEFKRILYIVSALAYLEDKFSFNKNTLIEYIAIAKQLEHDINFDEELFVEDLIQSVCILIEDGLELKFAHKSFQEYFTAKFIENLTSEEQNDILYKIMMEKPESILQDCIFETLFSTNRFSLESFLINVLNKIFSITNSENKEERYLNYLKLLFTYITLDYTTIGVVENINDEKDAIFFIVNKNGKPFSKMIEFIKYKYGTIYPIPPNPISVREDVDMFKKLAEFDDMGEYSYDLNKVQLKSELFEFILRHAAFYIRDYTYIEYLFKELKITQVKNKSLKSMLFKG